MNWTCRSFSSTISTRMISVIQSPSMIGAERGWRFVISLNSATGELLTSVISTACNRTKIACWVTRIEFAVAGVHVEI